MVLTKFHRSISPEQQRNMQWALGSPATVGTYRSNFSHGAKPAGSNFSGKSEHLLNYRSSLIPEHINQNWTPVLQLAKLHFCKTWFLCVRVCMEKVRNATASEIGSLDRAQDSGQVCNKEVVSCEKIGCLDVEDDLISHESESMSALVSRADHEHQATPAA
jgi:hypothetical protein